MDTEGRRLRVGVIFGSRSVEHEVSIVTALQVMGAMNPARYEVVPLYITKEGRWLTGPGLTQLETFKDLDKEEAEVRQAAISADTMVRTLVEPEEVPVVVSLAGVGPRSKSMWHFLACTAPMARMGPCRGCWRWRECPT